MGPSHLQLEPPRLGAGRRTLRRSGPAALAAFLLVSLLAGCMGRGDSTAPIVAITEPKSGTTRPAENLTITGYAMDDTGVATIDINGTDVLKNAAYKGEKGKRLVRFRFAVGGLQDGEVTTHIKVVDVTGRASSLDYQLTIDNTAPTVALSKVAALGGGQVHVEGEAKDNNRVASITVNGQPLAFTPGADVPFSVDVPAKSGGAVVVEDSAGNKTSKTLQ
ncbi:MAG TPA: hypothetical protein VKA00_08940 [Trueperaceae bacterium]|nr:hypothetical protein [Trueperaceae bacterium]